MELHHLQKMTDHRRMYDRHCFRNLVAEGPIPKITAKGKSNSLFFLAFSASACHCAAGMSLDFSHFMDWIFLPTLPIVEHNWALHSFLILVSAASSSFGLWMVLIEVASSSKSPLFMPQDAGLAAWTITISWYWWLHSSVFPISKFASSFRFRMLASTNPC